MLQVTLPRPPVVSGIPQTGSDGRQLRGRRSSGAVRVGMERAGCRTLVRWMDGCGAPRRAPRSAWLRL